MILLNQSAILQNLKSCKAPHAIEIICLDTVDSTNNFLKTYKSAKSTKSIVCCAETQTLGRGRHNKIWASPYGVNIYMSIRCQINCAANKLGPFSLITALACLKAINKINVTTRTLACHRRPAACPRDPVIVTSRWTSSVKLPIKIKWPNDLFYLDKKIGGILIEIVETSEEKTTLVIGIGLNVNQTPLLINDNRLITSLYEQTGKLYDRNILIAYLIHEVITAAVEFNGKSINFNDDWNRVDYLKGKMVQLTTGTNMTIGTAIGVNANGELMIKLATGEIKAYTSGEVQLNSSLA